MESNFHGYEKVILWRSLCQKLCNIFYGFFVNMYKNLKDAL